jgi:hypothetical protein
MTRPAIEPIERVTGLEDYLPGQNAFTACVPRSTAPDSKTPPKTGGRPAKDSQRFVLSLAKAERLAAQHKSITEFKQGSYPNNFTTDPAKPVKKISVAGKRFATA